MSELHMARKKKVVWALFWLIFWFFVCRMPNWIFVMATMFRSNPFTKGMVMLKSVLVFLSVLNTVVNPWLYSRLNEPLKKILTSCTDQFCEPFAIVCSCLPCRPCGQGCKSSVSSECPSNENEKNSNRPSKTYSTRTHQPQRPPRKSSRGKVEPYTIENGSLSRHSPNTSVNIKNESSRSGSRKSKVNDAFF